jgi:hypothetical protein
MMSTPKSNRAGLSGTDGPTIIIVEPGFLNFKRPSSVSFRQVTPVIATTSDFGIMFTASSAG